MSELTFKIIVTEKKKDQTYTCLYTGANSELVREKFLDHLREIHDYGFSENLYEIKIQQLAHGNRVDGLDSTWVIVDESKLSLEFSTSGINNDSTQEKPIKGKNPVKNLLSKFEKIYRKINPSKLFNFNIGVKIK